ncbi:hypothetical protein SLA2020_498940 [Shorea laevis]
MSIIPRLYLNQLFFMWEPQACPFSPYILIPQSTKFIKFPNFGSMSRVVMAVAASKFAQTTSFFILIYFSISLIKICLAAARPNPSSTETNTQFINTSCHATTYPDLCFTSLSSYASKIQASPMLLASTALSVTLNAARSTSTMMTKLSKSQDLKPRETASMHDCVEELKDSVYELHRSISEMGETGGKDFSLRMSDIETWVSAALTDDDTCMDGFSGDAINGNVKTAVRSQVLNVAHLTSNALALVNSYASTHN